MSNPILTMAWEVALPPMEKLVLAALADFANEAGLAWPSVATLCRRTGAGERTVYRSLTRLREAGHLSYSANTSGKSTRYHVHPCHTDTPAREAPLPQRQEPLPEWHPTPATQAVDPCQSGTLTLIEPPLTPQEPKARASKASKPKVQPKIVMSDDWQPAPLPDHLAKLVARWPAGRLELELHEFRDYWIEQGERRPGWDRTWRKRIGDVHDRVMRDGRGGWQVGGAQAAADPTDDFVRRMERKEAQQRAGVEQ